jgi:Fe-S cluster assembly protein SufD
MKEPVLFKQIDAIFESGKPGPAVRALSAKKGTSRSEFAEWTTPSEGTSLWEIGLLAEEEAQLEYVFVQNLPLLDGAGKAVDSISRLHVTAQANATVNLTIVQSGSAKSLIEVVAHCHGKNSEIHIRGLQNARGSQKLATTVQALHDVPHTKSDLSVWCVARDQSHSVFNGIVTIKEGAHHTEAYQKNKNLNLSAHATIDSFPKLFIANHDVKCAHGSSTSTLDPDQALYLQSRGIDLEAGEKMLVNGFLRQAVEWISNSEVKEKVYSLLEVNDAGSDSEKDDWDLTSVATYGNEETQ